MPTGVTCESVTCLMKLWFCQAGYLAVTEKKNLSMCPSTRNICIYLPQLWTFSGDFLQYTDMM